MQCQVYREKSRSFRKLLFSFLFSCQVCGSYDASLDSPSLSHDKGATVTAVYTEVDRECFSVYFRGRLQISLA